MPPDADKVRQRKHYTVEKDDVATQSTQSGVRKLAELKTTEISIDGAVYDIEGFDHPGGDSIHVFGGNDVTAMYKMIHPYHTSKHLEKMNHVGKVSDFVSE